MDIRHKEFRDKLRKCVYSEKGVEKILIYLVQDMEAKQVANVKVHKELFGDAKSMDTPKLLSDLKVLLSENHIKF